MKIKENYGGVGGFSFFAISHIIVANFYLRFLAYKNNLIAILMKYILLSSILVIVIVVIFSKYCNFKYFYFYWHGHPNNTNSTTVSSDDDGSSRKPYEIFGTHYSPLIDECKQRFCVKKIT